MQSIIPLATQLIGLCSPLQPKSVPFDRKCAIKLLTIKLHTLILRR